MSEQDTTIKLEPALNEMKTAQQEFFRLLQIAKESGGLTKDRYIRYLSMQFHLTKGVQRHFLTVAAHPDIGHRRGLRKFLVNFANEEEFHFELARKDLKELDTEPLPIPFDVELWWAYFDKIVPERPFVRLGATVVLENISSTSQSLIQELFSEAPFLTPKNTVFFRVHQHDENLPHGDQIIEALEAARLEAHHYNDLAEGAVKGAIMYLRMARWALGE